MSATTATTTTTTATTSPAVTTAAVATDAPPTVTVTAARATSARTTVPLAIASGASVIAALIHYGVVPEHRAEWTVYAVFFTVLGAFQLIWAAAIWARRCNRLLTIGGLVNAAVIALWIVTRTAGLPFGPDAGTPEAVGVVDILCVTAEAVTVAAVATVLLSTVIARKRG